MLDVLMNGSTVGRISLNENSLCVFEYDNAFLKEGFSLSPFHLPLQSGLFTAPRMPFAGGFGVFDDSLPDGWGSLLLDRYLRKKGIEPEKLSLLQRLALTGSRGRGALEYYPDNSVSNDTDTPDLNSLSNDAEKILTTKYSGEGLDTLYKYSGSSGGARPKVFVEIDDRQWLVKFKASTDPHNIGRIEYDYSLLARECGIAMPITRLFEGKYFGVERFDRSTDGKIHIVSAAGLLHADYRIPSLDYFVLLKACMYLTKSMIEVQLLFRLMVFNIAISNRDDHAKNFSFQYRNGAWTLSPAYDLLPSSGFNGYHTTTVNGQGDPSLQDIMQVAAEAGISTKTANEIIEQVTTTCRKHKKLNNKNLWIF